MNKQIRFVLKAAVHLLLIHEEKILLLKRYNTGWEDGKYSLISGHLNGNESIVGAMIREAKEEADIVLEENNLAVVHTMHRIYLNEEYLDFYLIAKKWDGKLKNMEQDKCDDLSWFPIDTLPQNTIHLVKMAIEKYKRNIYFSEYGFSHC